MTALDRSGVGFRNSAELVRRVLVSHGYETIYERGFCNGVADSGVPFLLISSDRTDYDGLRRNIDTLNLRGSQEEARSRWGKLFNLVAYHLRLIWYALTTRPEVLHVFGMINPVFFCGIFEGLIFRICCGRYILTVHNILPHDRHTKWNSILYGLSFRLADYLVVHTERMREQIALRYQVDLSRVVVMHHGIEPQTELFAPARTGVAGARMNILFFGKVLRYKGVDVLLSALEKFTSPFELTIAGGVWDESIRRELRAQIAAHPHSDCISWEGKFIPEADIAPLFRRADVVVLPYRYIDQSGILFQALRFGVPVVATRVGSFAEYVTEEVGELCAPDDADDLRHSLERIHQRLPVLSKAAIAEVGKKYEWSNTVEPLRGLYGAKRGQAV